MFSRWNKYQKLIPNSNNDSTISNGINDESDLFNENN